MIESSTSGKKFSGIYRGKVISHLLCGRCKIWIPDVYPEIWSEFVSSDLKDAYGNDLKGAMLPDAEQASPLFGGAMTGNGSFSYPKLGSYVWCMFEREEIQHPVYFASAIDLTDMEKNSGDNSFVKTAVNSESGKNLKHIITCGKSVLSMSDDGKIDIYSTANMDYPGITIDGSSGTIKIHAPFVEVLGNIITVGNGDTEQLILQSGQKIDVNAYDMFKNNSGQYLLSTLGTCQIHNKELNKNFDWPPVGTKFPVDFNTGK